MSLFSIFRKKGSAPVARERLQILLAHERSMCGQTDLLAILREEILAVITRHITVSEDNVQVKMDRGDKVSMLEILEMMQRLFSVEQLDVLRLRRGQPSHCPTQVNEVRLHRCVHRVHADLAWKVVRLPRIAGTTCGHHVRPIVRTTA